MTEKLPLFRSLLLLALSAVIAGVSLAACSGESVDVSVAPSTTNGSDSGQDAATQDDATQDAAQAATTDAASDATESAATQLTDEEIAAQQAMVDPTGLLAEVVAELDADPSGAPAAALDLGTAAFCGFDIVDDASNGSGEDPSARACFIAGVADNVETVLIQSLPGDGKQNVHVYRVDPTLGAVTDHSDSTGWAGVVCKDVVAVPEEGPNQFKLEECSALS